MLKLVTTSSLSGRSQTFRPEPWIWTGWEDGGYKINDGFIVDFNVRMPEKVFAGRVLDVGENIFGRSKDDTRLFVVSRLERGKSQNCPKPPWGRTQGRTHQGEGLSGCGLSAGEHNSIVTLHSGEYVVPGNLVVNRFVSDLVKSLPKWHSGGVVLEDFVYWGLSLVVWKLEDGRSHATAFEVGSTLDENKCLRESNW